VIISLRVKTPAMFLSRYLRIIGEQAR